METAARTPEETVRGYWQRIWCEGRADAVTQFYSATAVQNDERVDLDEFAAMVRSWFTKFPDFTATIEDLVVVDDRVFSRVTYRGTHLGSWAGLPATGRTFAAPGLDVFRVIDGSIVEHWHAADHYDLVLQLGGRVVLAHPDVSLPTDQGGG